MCVCVRVCVAALSGSRTSPPFGITAVLTGGLEGKRFWRRRSLIFSLEQQIAAEFYLQICASFQCLPRNLILLWWKKARHGTLKSLCSLKQASLHHESHTQLICWCWSLNQNTKSGWAPSNHLPRYLSIAAFVGLFNRLWYFSMEIRKASALICSPNPSVYGCIWCMLNNDTDSLMWKPNKLSSRRSPRFLREIGSEERPRKVGASSAAPRLLLQG